MDSEADHLRALGLSISDDLSVRAECARIARRIVVRGSRVIGLWPASSGVAAPPLAIQLGVALAELTTTTVAFVDANLRWPAAAGVSELVEQGAEDQFFATFWLHQSLALIVPRRVGVAGAGGRQLKLLVERSKDVFHYMLVDLTGFDRLGEHLEALDLVDGAIVIGQARQTTENELLRLRYQLSAEKTLGVILVG